jgi:hypothetical protein
MQPTLIYLFLQTLYMFQAVPPPIIRSTYLYKELQILLTDIAAAVGEKKHRFHVAQYDYYGHLRLL